MVGVSCMFNLLFAGPMTVMVTKANDTYVVGSDVTIKCVITGDGPITKRWTKDKQPLPDNPR